VPNALAVRLWSLGVKADMGGYFGSSLSIHKREGVGYRFMEGLSRSKRILIRNI
jgi:hypothetical protein